MPFKKGNQFSKGNHPKTQFKKGNKIMVGRKRSTETKQKISEARFKNPTRYWLGKHLSEEHIHNATVNRGKYVGENSCHYKGGITPENVRVRTSIEMKLWRDAVFARDNFTDQKTGVRGGKLVAHHILNFAKYPELRFAIDNGITLSKESHDEFHKIYGRKNNTAEQLREFLKRQV